MKSLLAVSIALSIAACGKPDPGPPPQTPETNASAESAAPGASDMASAPPVDSTPVATATAAAPPPSSAPTDATGQKGVASGKAVIVAFRTPDPKDKGICWAIVGTSDALADFNKNRKKNTATLAKKLKLPTAGTYLESCPQDSIVGTCESAFKMLVDYYSPTFTLDTAKRHCIDDQMGTWVQ
jgi:hypothetical protein